MPANIKFRKPHMTFIDGYFYMFDDDSDMLLQKTDDGITAFSYPLDTVLTTPVIACEYDGVNFWTLYPGSVSNTLVVQRWTIENYTCKLKTTFNLNSSEHKYNGQTFTVEHYHCTLNANFAAGASTVIVTSTDNTLPGILQSGMSVTIGPNQFGQLETINVQHVINNQIILSDPIENSYVAGDPVLFYNHIWLFNNANGLDTATGALYKFNAYSGSFITKFAGGEFKDIKASTFSEIDHFMAYGKVNSLMFVKASNLLFIDISPGPKLKFYGSMAMDTIESDKVTIIPVYAISVYKKNLYRLQVKATYYGTTELYTAIAMSYQPATFNQLAASLSLMAYPNIIAANGVSTSEITATVRDQFLQPLNGKLVYFNMPTGSVPADSGSVLGPGYQNTGADGKAVITYKSGNLAKVVQITARVQQS